MRKKRRRWPVVALAAGLAVGVVVIGNMVSDLEGGEPPTCIDGPTTPGMDVSYYQETIDWNRVHGAGIRFAFIRVSDGANVVDSMFKRNWAGAKQVQILRGAYQYFRPDESVTAQADLLIAAVEHDPGELAPVIDVEVTGGKTPAQIATSVGAWIARVRARLGVEPIVYTSPEFWRDAVDGADVSTQPLWVAHYTKACPRVPAPWTRWVFWQHSKTGHVQGISGPVDLDVFAGDLASLRAARGSTTTE